MRNRLLVGLAAAVVAVVVVVAVVAVVVVVQGGPELTAADRDLLAEALEGSTEGDGTDADRAASSVRTLAGDDERWERLVAAGGDQLATLLDRAQPALGQAPDAAARAAPVVEPLLAGGTVDDEVLPALGRWTWPLLADGSDGRTGGVRRVLAVADQGDDDRDAVTGGVVLARAHRLITSPADGFDAIEAWRSELAAAAIADGEGSEGRTSALVDGDFVELPAELARRILETWGTPGASAPFRTAIAAHPADAPVRAGSVRTIAAYIAVIDDEDETEAARAAADLAEDARDLVELEDELFNAEDPALARVGETATLLAAA